MRIRFLNIIYYFTVVWALFPGFLRASSTKDVQRDPMYICNASQKLIGKRLAEEERIIYQFHN